MKLLCVINPISGGKVKNDWEAAIRGYFAEKPHQVEFYVLNGRDDKRSVQHYIERIAPERVIAVGGDGTVKLLAGILKETPIPLAIIPAGSANGMAKELGIPTAVDAALRIIEEGEVRKIDLIKINEEEVCLHVSDIGLNALLVKYFEQSKKRGMWGYGKAIFRVIMEKQKMRATITTDDGTHKRKAYMVALANARKYGTGANINPEGDVSDGIFEVVVVRKINLIEICKSIFTNRPFHPKRIEVFPTKTLELSLQRKAYFQVDGEFLGKTARLSARILPGIIHVVLPKAE